MVLDGLRDAVVVTDEQGEIRYVNAAAEELLGWPQGSLVGRPVFDLVPESLSAAVGEDYGAFVRSQAYDLVGRRLDAVIKRADGTDVDTELVISIFDHPLAGRVVVGILRPRDEKKLQRWSELTSELLEILADAPIDEPPAERLLSTLGRRLDWDVTTLWALTADQRAGLPARVDAHARASRPPSRRRRRQIPPAGARASPAGSWTTANRSWVPDLASDQRFVTDALAQGRAAERLRLPGPLPRRLRRDRQDAEPPPARARLLGGRAHGRGRRPPGRAPARVGPGDRAPAPGRGAPRGPAPQRVPPPGDPGALRGRRLPRDGRAPGPGLGAR